MSTQDSLKIVRLGQLETFKNLLADVAKSGVASDVAITAITGVTGANVQAALEDIAGKVGDWKDKVVSSGFGAVVSNGQITVKNGVALTTPEAATGVADGTYLVLNIENDTNPVFVPAQQLVDVYTAAANASEVQLAINANNVISASIVEMNGSKLTAGSVAEGKLDSSVATKLTHAETAFGWGNHAQAGYALASNTISVGAANKGVYFDANGAANAMTYALNKTVPADAVFTDDSVTSAANHYAPVADNSSELTASLEGTLGAYALNTQYEVVTGVKAQRDAKGHVTGITISKQAVKDTNTEYAPAVAAVNGVGGTNGLLTGADKEKIDALVYATDADINALFA